MKKLLLFLVIAIAISAQAQTTETDTRKSFTAFFRDFIAAYEKNDLKNIKSHILFPLAVSNCFLDKCTDLKIKKEKFTTDIIYYKKPFLYEEEVTIKKTTAKVWYGYEATRYTLYFTLKNGRWYLVKVVTNSC